MQTKQEILQQICSNSSALGAFSGMVFNAFLSLSPEDQTEENVVNLVNNALVVRQTVQKMAEEQANDNAN